MEISSTWRQVEDVSFLSVTVMNSNPVFSLIVQSMDLNITESLRKLPTVTIDEEFPLFDASPHYHIQLINPPLREENGEVVVLPNEAHSFVYKISSQSVHSPFGGENISKLKVFWLWRSSSGRPYMTPATSSYPVEWFGVCPTVPEFELHFKGPYTVKLNYSTLLEFVLKNNTHVTKTIKLVTGRQFQNLQPDTYILFHERELIIENLDSGKCITFHLNVLGVKEGISSAMDFAIYDIGKNVDPMVLSGETGSEAIKFEMAGGLRIIVSR